MFLIDTAWQGLALLVNRSTLRLHIILQGTPPPHLRAAHGSSEPLYNLARMTFKSRRESKPFAFFLLSSIQGLFLIDASIVILAQKTTEKHTRISK